MGYGERVSKNERAGVKTKFYPYSYVMGVNDITKVKENIINE